MKTSVQLLVLLMITTSCNNSTPSPSSADWLIPSDKVFDGGPGKDGIPALLNPQMANLQSSGTSYLKDDDLILVYQNNNEIKAYSHNVLDWHEIINDQVGNEHIAITYCPLTGTGIGWGRKINNQITTFGVSGLLYETNLMPYDRATDSYWNQMFNQCVKGELRGNTPTFFNLAQMNFKTLKKWYPGASITTSATGHSRNYTSYPYGDYKTNDRTLFPVSRLDTRIHPKEFVRGVVINNKAVAYRFPSTPGRSIKRDQSSFPDTDLYIITDKDAGFIASFLSKKINNITLKFELINDSQMPQIIMKDQLGNKWDALGRAVEGPNKGELLDTPYSYMGYWFSWVAFYPDITLINN